MSDHNHNFECKRVPSEINGSWHAFEYIGKISFKGDGHYLQIFFTIFSG